ncbi:hypothetical protein D3C76_1711780 [compost metagenome]
MLVQLRVIADRAGDTKQAIILLAVVVHDEIGRHVGRVGRQFQRPRVGNVQVALGVFMGVGEGAGQQQGGQDEGLLEHGMRSPICAGSGR